MEYRYNDRYEKLCDKYCVDTTIDIYGSLISPYSTITISLSDFDNDEEIAFMTAYAISMDEIEEDDLSIFDIFDEIDSDQTEAGYAIEKYLEKNFDSLHSKYFEYFDGLKRCVLYIGTVYVNPEYRHNGIAQFLFENYQLILSRYGIIPILSAIIVQPQSFEGRQCTGNIDDDNMKKLMTDVILKYGFFDPHVFEDDSSLFLKEL